MKTHSNSRRFKFTIVGLALTGIFAAAISGQVAPPARSTPALPAAPPAPVPVGGPPSAPFPPTPSINVDPVAPSAFPVPGVAPDAPVLPPEGLPPRVPVGLPTAGANVMGSPRPEAPAAIEDPTQARDQLPELEAKVAAFDGRRGEAVRSVFQLGECYRKAGHFGEAATQYARVMREFADFPDLVQVSRKLLAETELRTPVMQAAPIAGFYGRAVGSFPSPVAGRADAASELRHLQAVLAVLQETAKPEALPPNVVNDPRYVRLKNDFEAALTTPKANGGPDRDEEIERRRERLSDWLRQIYIPEQENAIKLLTHELQYLNQPGGAGSAPTTALPTPEIAPVPTPASAPGPLVR